MATDIIKDGDYLIVKTETVLRLVELKKNKPQYLGKRKANLFAAVGHPFGTFFEIKSDGSLVKLENPEEAQNLLVQVRGDADTKADNRALVDTGESQRLSSSDIEAFKKQGMSGQDMVMRIVENSNTFQDKTAFAKEKYLRKKQKKYLNYAQLLRPNVRLLAEMYYMQGPLKICNLRIDSLSQMLAFCNVVSGGKYVVMDTALGLLTAAVLERLGAAGHAVQVHLGPFSIHPNQQVIKALNVPQSQLASIFHNVDFKSVSSLSSEGAAAADREQDGARGPKAEKREHVQKAREILARRDADGLLVAVRNHPSNALRLLDLLAFSRPFAVFSAYLEPLVECYVKLKSRGDVVSLNITETWLRKYQVLPDRTHPCYNMSGSGGYLLTGIRVAPKH